MFRSVRLLPILAVSLFAGLTTACGSSDPRTGSTGTESSPTAAVNRIVPLDETASIGNGWKLRVLSVDWNANHEIAAVNRGRAGTPRRGSQDVMLLVEISYDNAGTPWAFRGFADRVQAWASPSSRVGFYGWGLGVGVARNACGWGNAKLPPPDTIQPLVASDGSVHAGDKLRGHICFEVERRDVHGLHLRVDGAPSEDPAKLSEPSITFALRHR